MGIKYLCASLQIKKSMKTFEILDKFFGMTKKII